MLNLQQNDADQAIRKYSHQDLLKTFLQLEPLDENTFRSTHQLPGRKDGQRVYGGQVVGQSLMAASATIDPQFHPHSLHCQFISAADKDLPITYHVIRVRDGRSFCSRIVQAKQQDLTVFTSQMSFQVEEPDAICHAKRMPHVPDPENCEDASAFFQRLVNNPESVSPQGRLAADAFRKILDLPYIFGIKIINPRYYINMPTDQPQRFAIWVKSLTPLTDKDKHLHHCVAGFISDVSPIGTPLCANSAAGFQLGMAASLDHSMWIHRHDFRMDDDWVLYETESTVGAGGRALIHGIMWARKTGQMLLSTAQEILIRAQKTT